MQRTALHQNCYHLDMKPGNVLIQDDGNAMLLDFGLSSHAHYPDLLAEELRQAVGSPAWIAPEQIVGVRGDLRSDIFALGVMLYELTNGALPFGSPSTQGGMRLRGPSWFAQLRRWIQATGMRYHPSHLPAQQIMEVPILMVAAPTPMPAMPRSTACARPWRARCPPARAQGWRW